MNIRELPDDVISVILEHWEPVKSCVQINHFSSIRESISKGALIFSPETFSRIFSEYINRTVTSVDFVTQNGVRAEEEDCSVLQDDQLRMQVFNYHAAVVELLCATAAMSKRSKLRTLKLAIASESIASHSVMQRVGACGTIQELVIFQNNIEDELLLAGALVQLSNLKKVHISSASKITLKALQRSKSNVEDLKIGKLDINSTHDFHLYLFKKGKYIRDLALNGYAFVTSKEQVQECDYDQHVVAEMYVISVLYHNAKTYMPNLATLEVALISDLRNEAGNSFTVDFCSQFSGFADLLLKRDSIGTVFFVGKHAEGNGVLREMEFRTEAFDLVREFPSVLAGLRVFHLRLESSMSIYASNPEMRDAANCVVAGSRTWLETIECRTCPTLHEGPQVVFEFLSGLLLHCGPKINLQCSASLLKHFRDTGVGNLVGGTYQRTVDQMHKLQSVQLFRQNGSNTRHCDTESEEDVKILEGIPYFLHLVMECMPRLEKITFSRAPASVCGCCKKRLMIVLEDAILAVHLFSEVNHGVDVSDLYLELLIWWRKCH